MNEMYNIDDNKNYEALFICIQGILQSKGANTVTLKKKASITKGYNSN